MRTSTPKRRRKKSPKRVLALPDLEQPRAGQIERVRDSAPL
jgi:hypothetical protein